MPGQPEAAAPDPEHREAAASRRAARTPSLYDLRSPEAVGPAHHVPVFMVGALEDEQTGPQWPASSTRSRHDPPRLRDDVNGTHVDSLGPGVLSRWLEFLDLYVAGRLPTPRPGARAVRWPLPGVWPAPRPSPCPTLPLHRQRRAWPPPPGLREADPPGPGPVRQRRAGGGPGALQPEWEADFGSWPPPQGRRHHLRPRSGGAPSGPPDGAARCRSGPTRRPARPPTWPPQPTSGRRSPPTTGPRYRHRGVGLRLAPLRWTTWWWSVRPA